MKSCSRPSDLLRTFNRLTSDVDIIVQHRLESASFHIRVHIGKGTAVADLELLVAGLCLLAAFVLLLVVADPGRDTRRDLGGTDLGNAVAEGRTLAAGDGNAGKRQENTVGAEYLAELALADITRIDPVIVDNGAQAGTAQ